MLKLAPHPELHSALELFGYLLGFAWYKWDQSRSGDVVTHEQRSDVIAAAVVGALIGSRLLGLLDEYSGWHFALRQVMAPGGGKTIVGGLLGGWFAVELLKRLKGIYTRTGDLFAVPLCIGIATGRIGCLLAGLGDDTYGKQTSLAWGVDFGDGVARHPTQAYEIAFLILLGFVLNRIKSGPHATGVVFRDFMASYLVWRLLIDFLKPRPMFDGMNVLQWASLAGLTVLAWTWRRSQSAAETGRV